MQLPMQFGRYELVEFLGGGMSHVYRSVDTVLGRTVVVKILTDQGIRDEESKQRFLQEARILGTIQHDNIVTVHDYGEEKSYPYIVMEFLRGEDLREAIRKLRTGDTQNRGRIALEMAQALAFVHGRGIIHRDVKPENVFIEESGRAKLMDFGISKSEEFNLTKAGNSMGTPFYMAPEQVNGSAITSLVDIYSYGMVLYELFSGVRPVTGDTLQRLFYVILHESPDEGALLTAGTPQAVIDLIRRCTAKQPEDRIQSFGALVEMWKGILAEGRAPEATPVPPASQTATPTARPIAATSSPAIRLGPIAAAAVGALIAGALLIWFLRRPKVENAAAAPPLASERDAKGGAMVLVSAGSFHFSAAKTKVDLPAFYIDRTEVSNHAYQTFASERSHPLPRTFASEKPDMPIAGITFDDAREFCRWAGKELPDEMQWERAARGQDGRIYPWGNEMSPSLAVVKENQQPGAGGPAPVATFDEGASPVRALHMAGNVWEWVEKSHTPSVLAVESFAGLLKPAPTSQEPWHYIKGGAFNHQLAEAVAYEWVSVPARFASVNIGFRCALVPK